jgi:DNA-binding MarR family transcriptional regulator
MVVPAFDPIAEARRQWDLHGWTDSSAGMAAVTTIVRVHQLLMSRIDEVLEPFGLSFARYEILTLLSFTRNGRLPMGKLGQRLQVHPASVTSAVKRLEAGGLVHRLPHPDDTRSTIAALLPAGRRLVGPATDRLNLVFSSLGGDLDNLVERLNRIRAQAGDPV